MPQMVKVAEPMLLLAPDALVFQGAESKVYEVMFLGKPTIVKHRFSKKYRLSELDEKLTQSRVRQEARSMLRARKEGILTPVVYLVDTNSNCLYMEKIVGRTVREALGEGLLSDEERTKVLREAGRSIAKLHNKDIIHGDLTTSNVLIRKSDQAIILIDFGLSSYSRLPEDKGVDLYVLERAISSAHPGLADAFNTVLEEYENTSNTWTSVNSRYQDVRMRGRKRSMVG